MTEITHDEFLTYWKLDTIRHLKNSYTSLQLYANETSFDDVVLGRYYDDMADQVDAILKTFMDSVRGDGE